MRVRDVYLLNAQTLNDSDTVIVDLTRGLKILSLFVKYQNTNGATSNTVSKLNGMVSKIQVLDGSNVLHSLSMQEELALNWYQRRKYPYAALTQVGGNDVVETCFVDFWRRPGDMSWYLDTSNYANPQLQLTHNFTISATAGFATGKGKLTVIARVIDSGAPSKLGFQMSKELDSFATAASGDHNTDLPLDFPIAGLLMINPADTKGPDDTLNNWKLTVDTDSFIPVNASIYDLLIGNIGEFGELDQSVEILTDTTFTWKSDVYYPSAAWAGPAGATAKLLATVLSSNEVQGAMTTGESGSVRTSIRGGAPQSSIWFPFGDGFSPDQIFSPQGVGKFQSKLTSNATGATAKVVAVQQHP